MANQHHQQFVFNGREVDFLVVEEHLPLRQVHAQIAQGEDRLLLGRIPSDRMPERDADSCQEFAGIEGLRKIVIGARIERP